MVIVKKVYHRWDGKDECYQKEHSTRDSAENYIKNLLLVKYNKLPIGYMNVKIYIDGDLYRFISNY